MPLAVKGLINCSEFGEGQTCGSYNKKSTSSLHVYVLQYGISPDCEQINIKQLITCRNLAVLLLLWRRNEKLLQKKRLVVRRIL